MEIIIYTLQSTRNLQEVRYVGKTNQTIKRRLSGHLSAAKKSLSNNYTQNHNYNWINKELKDGYDIIITELDKLDFQINEDWEWLEQYWISQIKSWGFNINNLTKGGDGNKNQHFSKESIEKRAQKIRGIPRDENVRRKISQGLLGCIRSEETKNKVRESIIKIQGKPVKQYDLEGNFLKEWEYIKQAATALNIDASNIGACCNKKPNAYHAGGFIWRFSSDNSPIELRKIDKILQFDLDGNFIKSWNNMNAISKALNIPLSSIYRNCVGDTLQSHKYVFIKESNYNENIKFPGSNKPGLVRKVEQYSMDGELLNVFDNCTEAGKFLKIDRKKIAKCCKHEIPSYKEFVFKYV